MKRYIKKICLGVCLAASIMLASCGKQESSSAGKEAEKGEQTQEKTAQKGRYRETEAAFPKEIKTVFDVKQEDGVLQVLYESAPGSLYLAESKDKGKNWVNKTKMEAGELPNGYRAADAALKKDGTIVISAGKMSEEPAYRKRPVGQYACYILEDNNGSIETRELPLEIPGAEGGSVERGYGIGEFMVSEDNFLYGTIGIDDGEAVTEYLLVCISLEDGTLKWSKKTGVGDMKLEGDTIYLHESDSAPKGSGWSVKKLEAATGEASGTLILPKEISNFEKVDFNMEDRNMYYCAEDGIYFSDLEGTFSEQLVDSRLSGFSGTGYKISGLYTVDENCLLLFMQEEFGGDICALQYEYDPELLTVPDRQLNIYSLKQSRIMEKMVEDFRKENQDILVNYEIGMQSGGQTISDAINSLNTEMMAGNGPDVLVLNSLPWESYIEKGLLLDLNGEAGALPEKEELYENLFKPYEKDGGWYAVPVSYKIPIIFGKAENIGNISSLEELTDAVKKSSEIPAFSQTGAELLLFVTRTWWNTVQAEDGSISEEKLSSLLEQTKSMNDRLMSFREVSQTAYDYGTEDIFNNAIDIFQEDTTFDIFEVERDETLMGLGNLSFLGVYTYFYCYGFDMNPAGKMVFSPLLAGISAKAKEPDIAKQFVNYILGEKEQEIFSAGAYPSMGNLPVNRKAFEAMRQQPSEDEMEEDIRIMTIQGYDYSWPDKAYFDKLETITEGLSIPAMEDTVVCKTVLEYGYPYLKGEKELASAVNEIIQKLELYQAE